MAGTSFNRRSFLKSVTALGAVGLWGHSFAQEMRDIADLKPGEFTWDPERQPTGPVAVVVSLPEQRVYVYRNGIRIAVSTCSTGKPGHETPSGVFVVLQKDKHHRSSTYDDAPMPNMNRLTWSGIALHAGNLPGYPASHGCVRLPMDFSERLFEVTHLGTPVIISGRHSDPWELIHPGMVLGAYAKHEFDDAVAGMKDQKHPSDWSGTETYPITSIIASSSDKRVVLIQNSEVKAEGNLTIQGSGPLGSHVFVLSGMNQDAQGLQWMGITHHAGESGNLDVEDKRVLQRVSADAAFRDKVGPALHPGAIFILTDAPLSPDSRSGRDFVIMT